LCTRKFQKIPSLSLRKNLLDVPADKNKIATWFEYLVPTTATPVAFPEHKEWGKYPAIVSNRYEKGTAIYEGTILSDELQEAVIVQKCKDLGLYAEGNNLRFPIIQKNSVSQSGKLLHFYLNYSDKIQVVRNVYKKGLELLSTKDIAESADFNLEPWGVAILEEK
jgi:beta-galactosidase